MRQSNDAATIAHVLNRAAYGPRRRDWRRVEEVGVEAYIGEQLEPERIADAEVEAKLEALPSLKMDIAGLYRAYPPPQLAERLLREDEELDEDARRRIAQQSRVPLQELGAARLLRAVESDRQLNEVLVDLWFNHFNVFANAGQVRYLLSTYEREAIRPHVLGSFRAMLGAVARSPAMLVYLDNWRSAAEEGRKVAGAPPRARNDAVEDAIRRMARGGRVDPRRLQRMQQRVQQAQRGNRPPGLNENYARELMELHTLGVDGGYTQDDVREVARALTGWTLTLGARQADDPGFVFRPDWHDAEEKRVLGTTLAAGRGIEDGDEVLDLLAEHPSTGGFIAAKLCRKLVADQPPPGLVAEVAATFSRTGGDLRATTAAVLLSKDFLGPDHRAAKVKSPLEFLASAARALEVPVGTDGGMLARTLQLLGAPLYGASAPTGYPDTAVEWTSANAILARMDVGSRLAAAVHGGGGRGLQGGARRGGDRPGQRGGRRAPTRTGPDGTVAERSEALMQQLLPGRVGDDLRAKILSWADNQEEAPGNTEIATLILGSPEFQRR